MATYSSKSDVKEALKLARQALKNARQMYGKESQQAKDALKQCNDLQYVLDRWDAINS